MAQLSRTRIQGIGCGSSSDGRKTNPRGRLTSPIRPSVEPIPIRRSTSSPRRSRRSSGPSAARPAGRLAAPVRPQVGPQRLDQPEQRGALVADLVHQRRRDAVARSSARAGSGSARPGCLRRRAAGSGPGGSPPPRPRCSAQTTGGPSTGRPAAAGPRRRRRPARTAGRRCRCSLRWVITSENRSNCASASWKAMRSVQNRRCCSAAGAAAPGPRSQRRYRRPAGPRRGGRR